MFIIVYFLKDNAMYNKSTLNQALDLHRDVVSRKIGNNWNFE